MEAQPHKDGNVVFFSAPLFGTESHRSRSPGWSVHACDKSSWDMYDATFTALLYSNNKEHMTCLDLAAGYFIMCGVGPLIYHYQ